MTQSPRNLFKSLAGKLRPEKIRSRLLVAFVALVLTSAIALSVVSITVGIPSGRKQVVDQLESVATIKEAELNTWLNNIRYDVAAAMIGSDTIEAMQLVLDLEGKPADEAAYALLHERWEALVQESPRIDELFLMDQNARVVLSTERAREGRPGGPGSATYFKNGLLGEYVQPPAYTLSVGGIATIVARPVMDAGGNVLGVLAGRAGTRRLSEIMLERAGLGETGETYLVTTSYVMLTEPLFTSELEPRVYYVFSEGARTALEGNANGYGQYKNYRGMNVIGVYRWLPELKLALVAEQTESEALGAIYQEAGLNLAVTAAWVVVAALLSFQIAGTIAEPLASLASTAARIAGGDFSEVIAIERNDEIGVLASAFKRMSVQLRDLIDSLEQRVRDRTQALRRRAVQLETSAQVSREITSILDIDSLLSRITEMIRDVFGYYHVHVYLVDPETSRLVLRASSAGQGLQITDLQIGEGSINGLVAQTNQTILINDVSADPRFLSDALLPDTHAELTIPLRTGDRVIGTLDVQSAEVNAFCEDDRVVIQSLGDQIAIAIENARLYEKSKELAMLEERSRLARELHDSVIQSLFSVDLHARAVETYLSGEPDRACSELEKLRTIIQNAIKEMRVLIFDLHPSASERIGLEQAVRQYVGLLNSNDGPRIVFDGSCTHRLNLEAEQALFRITQEAIRNALKHAKAEHIRVSLKIDEHLAVLKVADDGRGFDPESLLRDSKSLGLVGMHERAEMVGGSLNLLSKPGEGTWVTVFLPIKEG